MATGRSCPRRTLARPVQKFSITPASTNRWILLRGHVAARAPKVLVRDVVSNVKISLVVGAVVGRLVHDLRTRTRQRAVARGVRPYGRLHCRAEQRQADRARCRSLAKSLARIGTAQSPPTSAEATALGGVPAPPPVQQARRERRAMRRARDAHLDDLLRGITESHHAAVIRALERRQD